MLERAKDPHLSTGLAEIDVPFWSASRLARAIGEKKISSLEILNACLARVEKYNPRLNAVIELDISGARKRAQAADDALMRGESSGPLHGIPITVKDSIDVAGFASTWGVKEFKDNRPARSAPIVDALTAAGAIVFGKTNIPWFALSSETFNDLHGTTNNPWDLSRSPGGSSGGSAAALAAGLTCLEVGSDSGGSIRFPAHYCGIYAHKPTFGVTSIEGQSLPGLGPVPDIMVLGPLARSAEDLAIALNIMARPNEADAVAWRLELPPARQAKLSDFRVAVMLEYEGCDLDHQMIDILRSLVSFLVRQALKSVRKRGPRSTLTPPTGCSSRCIRLRHRAACPNVIGSLFPSWRYFSERRAIRKLQASFEDIPCVTATGSGSTWCEATFAPPGLLSSGSTMCCFVLSPPRRPYPTIRAARWTASVRSSSTEKRSLRRINRFGRGWRPSLICPLPSRRSVLPQKVCLSVCRSSVHNTATTPALPSRVCLNRSSRALSRPRAGNEAHLRRR
jgi:Amidase